MSNSLPYNVVFEYTEAAGSYAGVRTITAFKNKDDFDRWLNDPENSVLEREKVVAQGVTEDEATKLVDATSVESYAAACIAAATDSAGVIHLTALKCELTNVAMARAESGESPDELLNIATGLLRRSGKTIVDDEE